MQQEDRKTGKSGIKVSIIDVRKNVSYEEDFQQQNSPWKWLGEKWQDFLTQ